MDEQEKVVEEEIIEVVDYSEVMVQLLVAESNDYCNSENEDFKTQKIKNVCALAAQISEAEKIKNDRLKTQLEVELKDRMNERDNQVKVETMAEELKQRKNELLANKIESGAVLAANVGKNVLNYNLLGGVISGEYSGYTFRSNATKMAMDLAKAGPIKTRF